jgi:beta-galactosidase/beta-glucuronidase
MLYPTLVAVFLVLLLCGALSSAANPTGVAPSRPSSRAGWKPASAPLMTRWAKEVSPKNARPEYPRPQAVRRDWMSLNGLWEFGFDDADEGRAAGWQTGKPFPQRILVPWTYEAALSGIGKGKEVHERVWYRRLFTLPAKWTGRRILLRFGAVDWEATVWVNGQEMGTHRGGYAPFSFDITSALKPEGKQEIVVRVYDPADPKKEGYQPRGKQLGSEGIWYTRTTGIWQTVWLEPLQEAHIADFSLEPDLQGGALTVHAETNGSGQLDLQIRVSREGKPVASAVLRSPAGKLTARLAVPSAESWSPEHPALYDVTLTLKQSGRTTDEIKTYCAFRTFGIKDGLLALNGKPYFLRAVLDQGFWPDGIYTPPTDSAIRYDVEMTKALGFNMARKHVKVEDPRWYYWCDRLGLLVAQDMPSSFNLTSEEAKANFVQEWAEVMQAVRFHPSVVLWIPFNENWGDPKEFQDEVVDRTRAADPSRPIIDASGWTQRAKTDIIDIHDYGNDLKKHVVANPPKPRWIGEFGGVALPVEGHTWVQGWGYQTVKTPEELLEKFAFLVGQILNAPGLSGYCYTQLTDVEQELNGLLTYDRLPKAPPERFAVVQRGSR